MAAATVTKYVELGLPSVEVVQLDASDDETYRSRKFKAIEAALISDNDDTGTPTGISVTWSGATATVHWADKTDEACTLLLFGH